KILRHAHAQGALAMKITPRHNSLRVKQQCHSSLTHYCDFGQSAFLPKLAGNGGVTSARNEADANGTKHG
ncbi:MAG: hypothetical protein ACYC4B_01110, partial [Pirellulaceae bacterium]